MAAFVARRAFTALKYVSSSRYLAIQIPKRQFSFSKVFASRVYTEKHEWITVDGKIGTVGISDHAQELLGEIVFVETPEIGLQLETDDVAGCLESVKAASDVYSPVGGVVVEVNETLKDTPDLVNKSPLDEGWLYKMELEGDAKTAGLMDEAAYKKFLESLEH